MISHDLQGFIPSSGGERWISEPSAVSFYHFTDDLARSVRRKDCCAWPMMGPTRMAPISLFLGRVDEDRSKAPKLTKYLLKIRTQVGPKNISRVQTNDEIHPAFSCVKNLVYDEFVDTLDNMDRLIDMFCINSSAYEWEL